MLLSVFIAVVLFFVGFAALLYFGQGRLIFQPTSKHEATPVQFGLQFETAKIAVTEAESIHAWYFPCEKADSAATVLFCHGNAGNISHRLHTARFLVGLGVNVLLFDYRGYGQSDGMASEVNVYADAEAAYRWLLDEKGVRADRLFLFGRSLGGAVAIELATRVKCAGIVVESSFTSSGDMGQRMFPYLPIRLLVRYRFDSLGKIGRLTCPVLVSHSPDDDIIPYEMGRELFDSAGPNKTFLELEGVHNSHNFSENEKYINGLRAFLGVPPDSHPTL
jgi:hypothetical protein